MTVKSKPKYIGDDAVKELLERYECPVPFHAVRTRFLGNIATPDLGASPLQIVTGLSGGELPEFNTMADATKLIDALVQGVWNDLARHQKRSHPFRLTRLKIEVHATCLCSLARLRAEELEGFADGLFGGHAEADLPERAHAGVGALAEMRAMMLGIIDLVERDPLAGNRNELETTFRHLRELNRIMEGEIHETVMACTKARRTMIASITTSRSTVH
jgi:hypothetical protein